MKPLVSIVTPCYNAEKFIKDTVESILAQTYENWELFIIDDGSKDRSESIIEPFLEDSRITYLKNEKNSGVAFTRNVGIEKAQGKYLAFVDSDDIWDSTKLEEQIEILESSESDICFTAYTLMTEEKEIISAIPVSRSITIQDELKSSSMLTSSFVYDLEKLGKHHFIQIGHEDYLFKLELLKKSGLPAVGIPESKVLYRLVHNSLSHNKKVAAQWQWAIYRKHLRLPLIKCLYYFSFYIFRGVLKYYKLSGKKR